MSYIPSSLILSTLLGPNIFFIPIFSNNLNLCEDQVSYPYKAIGKIIFPYILIFIFLDIQRKKILDWMVADIPQYLNFTTFSKDLFATFMLIMPSVHTTWVYTLFSQHLLLHQPSCQQLINHLCFSLQHLCVHSTNHNNWSTPRFDMSKFTWYFPMAYSKEKLKSNGDKIPPFFRYFCLGNHQMNACLPGF